MAEATKKTNRVVSYFRELKAEFKRISWPSFKQVRNNTGVVLAFIILLGVFIAIVDLIFTYGLSFLG